MHVLVGWIFAIRKKGAQVKIKLKKKIVKNSQNQIFMDSFVVDNGRQLL